MSGATNSFSIVMAIFKISGKIHETPRCTAMTVAMLKKHANAVNDANGSVKYVKSKQLDSYPKPLYIIDSWSNVLCPISQRRHSDLVKSGDVS